MIAVVSPSSTSTSGRASVGMKPCTKALYVSLISRCDSAAIVPNTSELLPEPETPVNTVSRRFGSSMLTSLRLFTRAPCTRMRSWRSAACSAGDCVSVLLALLIVSPSVERRPSRRQLRRAPSTGVSHRRASGVCGAPGEKRSGLRDADEVARGVPEGAVARAPGLGGRLLEHLGARRPDLL